MNKVSGIGASPGIAIGPIKTISQVEVELPEFDNPKAAVKQAMEDVAANMLVLAGKARDAGRGEAAEVLSAQSLMAEDPMLLDAIGAQLDDNGLELGPALDAASAELQEMLASLPDPYLAARAADVGEVATAVRKNLAGVDSSGESISEPSVLIAEFLTAAETADLDPQMVLGFVTEQGGPTGHVAIIARSLGVPAVVGVAGLLDAAEGSSVLALDGSSGELELDPDAATQTLFTDRANEFEEIQRLAQEALGTTAQFDGREILVAANIGGSHDIDGAVEAQADGVGLFRTEFLFLDTPEPPTEDQQFKAYKEAAERCNGQVVIRAFDIGGDKPAEFISLPAEENPFLGLRGVRIYEKFLDLFHTQVRAVLRAAKFGDVAFMIPMVATGDEFDWVASQVGEVSATMAEDERGTIALGIMVEVPSVALTAGPLAERVDFFSIGTNDLTQYTMAADRTHGALGSYQDPLHPAVLKLCKATADGGATAGKSVSVCGEAAADPLAACVFAALGVKKLSVTPSAVNLIKSTLSRQSEEFGVQVHKALDIAATAGEFRELVMPFLSLR